MYLFIYRQRGREGEGEGEKCQCLVASHVPPLGSWPATQECALTGNQTSDSLVHRPMLRPLSYTSQGLLFIPLCYSVQGLALTHENYTPSWVFELVIHCLVPSLAEGIITSVAGLRVEVGKSACSAVGTCLSGPSIWLAYPGSPVAVFVHMQKT